MAATSQHNSIPDAHRHARNDIGSMSREGRLCYESHWWIVEVCVVPRQDRYKPGPTQTHPLGCEFQEGQVVLIVLHGT